MNVPIAKQRHKIKNETVTGIDAEGARALSEALKVNTTLKSLDLGGAQQQRVSCKQRTQN